MKRYIRTKDGTYGWIMTEEKRKALINCARGDYGFGRFDIPVDRETDTIGELCDCFVCVGSWHCVWDKETHKGITLDGIKLSYSLDNFEIYGAIWTGKGLIYKTKLNSKGDLELL